MSHARASKQLKDLRLRAAGLQVQLDDLAASRRALSIRNGLLAAMCDSLCFLQIRLACSAPGPQQVAEQEDASTQDFQELLGTEFKLLQQLSTESELGGCQPLDQLLQPEPGSLAP
jgi:hypothetical protein